MVTEINLAQYYLRKKEIEETFGTGTASAIKSAIDAKPNLGTTATTAAAGNHEHGKIKNDGTLSEPTTSVKNVVVTDTTNNNLRVVNKVPFANLDITKPDLIGLGIPEDDTNTTYTAGTGISLSNGAFSVNYGSSNVTACRGDDSRLSDERIPTTHTDSNGAYGKATTSVWGHTKLSNEVVSTSEAMSATPRAVNTVYTYAKAISTWQTMDLSSGTTYSAILTYNDGLEIANFSYKRTTWNVSKGNTSTSTVNIPTQLRPKNSISQPLGNGGMVYINPDGNVVLDNVEGNSNYSSGINRQWFYYYGN